MGSLEEVDGIPKDEANEPTGAVAGVVADRDTGVDTLRAGAEGGGTRGSDCTAAEGAAFARRV